jgi:hypothetical protein
MLSPETDKPEPAATNGRSLPQISGLEGVGADERLHSGEVQNQSDTYASNMLASSA